jgi:hypothetical protein
VWLSPGIRLDSTAPDPENKKTTKKKKKVQMMEEEAKVALCEFLVGWLTYDDIPRFWRLLLLQLIPSFWKEKKGVHNHIFFGHHDQRKEQVNRSLFGRKRDGIGSFIEGVVGLVGIALGDTTCLPGKLLLPG